MKQEISLEAITTVAFCLEGRDKLTKVLQYGSRFWAWYFLSHIGDPSQKQLGLQLQALYKATQQSRKAFRLGKSVNEYKKAKKLVTSDSDDDAFKQYLTLLRHTGMFGYYIFDNMIFLKRASVFPSIDASEMSKRGGKLWFMANICALTLAVKALQSNDDGGNDQKKTLALVKSVCDFLVSSNNAAIRLPERLVGSKLNDGIIGALGCVSASIVLYNTWPEKQSEKNKKK